MAQTYERAAKKYSVIIALTCSALATTVLIGGWLYDIAIFRTILPGLDSMKANTALAFFFSGLTLSFFHTTLPSWLTRYCSLLVIMIAATALCENVFGVNLGIDELLFLDPYTVSGYYPGRMALMTSVGITLLFSIARMARNARRY